MTKYDKIYEEFKKLRVKQFKLQNRVPTVIDEWVDQSVFREAWAAVEAGTQGKADVWIRALPLPTGSGKSTTTWAFIAAFAKHDPTFSCSYLVHTATIAEDVQAGIEMLLGDGSTVLWTNYHDVHANEADARQKLGRVPVRKACKAEIANARVVVLTHRQLRLAALRGQDIGVLTYKNAPRSMVVTDEYPDLVHQVALKAKRILALHDLISAKTAEHQWLPILCNMVTRMSAFSRTTGQTYCLPELLTENEKMCIRSGHGLTLWEFTDVQASKERRQAELEYIEDGIRFVQCCSEGRVFMSRQDKCFYSYELALCRTYPSFLLLDATCKLQSVLPMSPFVECVPVDELDYSNLQLHYMDWPKELRNSTDVIGDPVREQRYAALLKRFVVANSPEGAEVLITTFKAILVSQGWDTLTDPNFPADWEGRKVNVQHWGAGIGSNRFSHKTHVFQFGDYHIPRATVIAQTHAWSQKPLSDEYLKNAQGVKSANGLCLPKAMYGEAHEGLLLSASKQLAMRGSARSVGNDGKCGAMNLFVTMELGRLLPNLGKMFPGAPQPIEATYPDGEEPTHPKGQEGLVYFLVGLRNEIEVSSKVIEAITGIPTSKLTRAFNACSDSLSPLGWSIRTAKELNYSGKGLYLFNEKNYTRSMLDKEKSITLD